MKPALSLIVIACLLLSSCQRRVHCPAYEGTLLEEWFPYSMNDTICFSDNTGDTDTLIISGVEKSNSYSYTERSLSNERREPCRVLATIYSAPTANYPGRLGMSITHSIDDKDVTFDDPGLTITFDKMKIALVAETDIVSSRDSGQYKLISLQSVNAMGVSYHNVKLVEATSDSVAAKSKMDRLYIARGKGIIGFRTYPAGVEYWLK